MNLNRFVDAAALAGRVVPGLPSVPSSPLAARKPNIGATSTNLDVPMDSISASNQPSVKVLRLSDGSVAVEIRRNVRFPGLIDDRDGVGMRRLGTDMVRQMKASSKGALSTRTLRKMGHPYGRNARGTMRGKLGSIGRVSGVRGSVPSLSVVNSQSGAFARAWDSEVETDATGVTLRLTNDTEYSAFLAFGTSKMQAHGPFTAVPVRNLSRINSEWQRAVKAAYSRKKLESDAMSQLGMS